VNLFGRELTWRKKSADISIDQLINRLDAIYETSAGVNVTPDTCEQSPTVKAIITAVTRRFSVMPVHVFLSTKSAGRASKELQPSHPVARLLGRPNEWQTRTSYWMDSVSWLLRYGNYYAHKARGVTGPIQELTPLHPGQTRVEQDDNLNVTFKTTRGATQRTFAPKEIHHVRLTARNGYMGDSPVMDVREAIALEIAAEKFGASYFGGGAMPGIVFEYAENSLGFPTDAERWAFLDAFHARYSQQGRFKAIFPPKGVKLGTPIAIENDKAQFLQLRQLQRTIIAGAFGVPPHLVGDLSKGTFNNVEHQGIEFKTNVILPLTRIFEAAMERDLLTQEDRNAGIIIRFNPDGDLRGDFLSRQQGLNVQRNAGVISANDWREHEGMNPISEEDGGDEYWRQGQSGQSAVADDAGEETLRATEEDDSDD
jgi:HK97 family phage portal protein